MRKRIRPRRSTETVTPGSAAGAPVVAPRATGSRRTSPEEFAEEYAYVWQDLRRILTVALIMFLLLITLNLVLR
jgi:hypothetical protein